MPDALLVLVGCASAGTGRHAAERRSGLRVRRDAKRQRLLLRRRPGPFQSAVTGSRVRAMPSMGTIVSIEIVGPPDEAEAGIASERALEWFRDVERRCSRFDDASELRRLSQT